MSTLSGIRSVYDADNSKTHEVSIFDTSDLKSILEDITRMQNNAIDNDLDKTLIDMRPFNTPQPRKIKNPQKNRRTIPVRLF